MNYMIIGGDSFLGRSIAEHLRISHERIITTSRKKENVSHSCIYLDLREDVSSWPIPNDVDVVFFCAAITSIEHCRMYPVESRFVNVENTIALTSRLAKEGISIIFPSTNLVFDGQSAKRKADDPVCPCVEYGRQKATVEKALMEAGHSSAIIRLSKIYGPQTKLLHEWKRQLTSKIDIHPFSDMVVAPIPVDFATHVMMEIAKKKACGVWQVSAQEDITYEELARHIAKKINISQRYVQPIQATDSELKFESIAKHTTLDTSRIENELGFIPPDVWDTIDSCIESKNDDLVRSHHQNAQEASK